MKYALTVTGVLSLLSTIIAAIAKLNPDTFSSENFSFLEYLVRLFAVPVLFLTLLCFTALAFVATTGGKLALAQLRLLPDLSGGDLRSWLASVGWIGGIVFAASLAFAAYGFYSYGRVAYVFGRDRLLSQYQREVAAKLELELAFKSYSVVKTRLRALQSAHWYDVSADSIETQLKRIDERLGEVQRIVALAEQLQKTAGPNPRSLQLYALALSMHPWDESLQAKIRAILTSDLPGIIKTVQSVRDKCPAANDISALDAGKTMVGLGMHLRSEMPRLTPREPDGESVCRLLGDWSREKVAEYVGTVWQSQRIAQMVEAFQIDRLSARKQAAWQKWTTPRDRFVLDSDDPPAGRDNSDEDQPLRWFGRVPVPRLMPSADSDLPKTRDDSEGDRDRTESEKPETPTAPGSPKPPQ